MGPLVAVGGLRVPGSELRGVEIALDRLCARTGSPAGEEFKWSPGKDDWMYASLVKEARTEFFLKALTLAQKAGARAIVVMEDTRKRMARRNSESHEDDVTMLFLERAQNDLREGECALVVFDRPGGGRKKETEFLASCIEKIRSGTAYTKLEGLALALSSDSKLARVLQLADVITACSTSHVGGESKWSRPVFNDGIRPLLREEYGRRGGCGLKIHPDLRYGNLYHWLLGDDDFVRYQGSIPLPSTRFTCYRQSGDVA
jgi:hypothetical protein